MIGSNVSPLARIAKLHPRRRPAAWLSLGAVGLALVVAGCGSATGASSSPSGYRSAGARPTPTAPATQASPPPATTAPTTTAAGKPPAAATAGKPIAGTPQQNGGDGDPDNNGGPDDGDGAL